MDREPRTLLQMKAFAETIMFSITTLASVNEKIINFALNARQESEIKKNK